MKNVGGALTTATFDAGNQTEASRDGTGVTTYTFDATGNEQLLVHPDGTRTARVWDYENQNIRGDLPTGARITMLYNADNRRIRGEG